MSLITPVIIKKNQMEKTKRPLNLWFKFLESKDILVNLLYINTWKDNYAPYSLFL
jgi:hypothetical protein